MKSVKRGWQAKEEEQQDEEEEAYKATRDSRVKIMVIATAKNEDEFMFMNSSTSVIMKS